MIGPNDRIGFIYVWKEKKMIEKNDFLSIGITMYTRYKCVYIPDILERESLWDVSLCQGSCSYDDSAFTIPPQRLSKNVVCKLLFTDNGLKRFS